VRRRVAVRGRDGSEVDRMCKTLMERLAVASVVAESINSKISGGALNLAKEGGKSDQYEKMDLALEAVRMDASQANAVMKEQQSLSGMLRQLAYFRIVKNSSKKHGVANCGEYAGYVYLKLYRKGIFPIHFISAVDVKYYYNHAFVVIGLPPSTSGKCYMSDWADDVVICDPWLMQRQGIYKKGKPEFNGAYTAKEYIEATKEVFRNGDKVECVFGIDASLGTVPKINLK
jgi:hypothetical protein